MKTKDQTLLEQAYLKVINEYHGDDDHDRDDGGKTFHETDNIIFEDPQGKPYVYEVSYEKKKEQGFYDDSVLGVEIISAKAYKKDSNEFLFDITNETETTLADIQDWVYNWSIGDSKLNLL